MQKAFGTMPDGTPVEEITLQKGALSCSILTYGGAVRALTVPDREGNPVDVALGFDTLADYRKQDKYIGALVGSAALPLPLAGPSTALRRTTARTICTAAWPALTSRFGRSRSRPTAS